MFGSDEEVGSGVFVVVVLLSELAEVVAGTVLEVDDVVGSGPSPL